MSLYLLNTDHITLYQHGHPPLLRNLLQHVADQLAISVITVEEQLTGWQTTLRQARDEARRAEIYRRMALTVESLAEWLALPFSLAAMNRHTAFLRQRLNIGSNDLKIAATALETAATVVTRNARDFTRVPGVKVEDWSV